MDPLSLARSLLLKVRMEEPAREVVLQMQRLESQDLTSALDTEARRKAFWINCYNAYFQILRKERGLVKPAVFSEKAIVIAGQALSLDDIEHGILRKYRWKWSLGYLPDLFVSRGIRQWAVQRVDYRIHFALNCGAKSCPPIAFYDPEKIDDQLDLAAQAFLGQETEVFAEKREIHTTRLFQWFKGDFGGNRGMRRILQEQAGLETKGWKIVYKAYDWDEALGNFSG